MGGAPEANLNALKKLEANKSCINCNAYSKFGHPNICEKYRTFVCSQCKSAHQSYSHRVKSVTMSNWTQAEVDQMKEENGGGNAAGNRRWYGRWDEGRGLRKPTSNDPLDYYKRFIDKVYNEKAYHVEIENLQVENSKLPSTSDTQASNLLDFNTPTSSTQNTFSTPFSASSNTFDAFGIESETASTATNNFANSGSFDAFGIENQNTQSSSDGWGAFESAPSVPSNSFADFSSMQPPPTIVTSQSSQQSMSSMPPITNPSNWSSSYDPFAAVENNSSSNSSAINSVKSANSFAALDPFAKSAGSQATFSNFQGFNTSSNSGIGNSPQSFQMANGNFNMQNNMMKSSMSNNIMGNATFPNGSINMGMQSANHSGFNTSMNNMQPGVMNSGMNGMQNGSSNMGFNGMQNGSFSMGMQMGIPQMGMNGNARWIPPVDSPTSSSNGHYQVKRDPFAGLGLPK